MTCVPCRARCCAPGKVISTKIQFSAPHTARPRRRTSSCRIQDHDEIMLNTSKCELREEANQNSSKSLRRLTHDDCAQSYPHPGTCRCTTTGMSKKSQQLKDVAASHPWSLWQNAIVRHFDDEQNLRPDDELERLLELSLQDHGDVDRR